MWHKNNMWMFEDTAMLLLFLVAAEKGLASIESYLERTVFDFGKEEADREECTLLWTDFLHTRVPDTLKYRRVGLTWTQGAAHYGPEVRGAQKELQVYDTKVDHRAMSSEASVVVERTVEHANTLEVWALDAKELVTDRAFTAGLKGIISTSIHSEESVANELEKTLVIQQNEKLSVRAIVHVRPRTLTKITWVITEAEAEVEWTVATTISGSFAICLRNSTHPEIIEVFSVAALQSTDVNLEVLGKDTVRRLTHGAMKSVTAKGSFIRVKESPRNLRGEKSSSTYDIPTQLIR